MWPFEGNHNADVALVKMSLTALPDTTDFNFCTDTCHFQKLSNDGGGRR